MRNVDADPMNADWTKSTWHLPPYKSKEFMQFLKASGSTLDDFRRLPVYKFAVRNGVIVNDEWNDAVEKPQERSSNGYAGCSLGGTTMDRIRSMYRIDLESAQAIELQQTSASTLKVKEKQIENWMATNPKLLFSNPEALMVMAQEVAGELMADILAVDSQGNLIIIEIKRHSSDRNTIAQILDYAARLATWSYDDFNGLWQRYSKRKTDLLDEFRKFVENPDFDADDFLRNRRLFILASTEDESVKRIIGWLRDTYAVPIDFVPFQFYVDNDRVLLEISKIDIEPLAIGPSWSGDWFFNTNETYCKGAYERMLEQNVIAVYGYEGDIGRNMLSQPAAGERVLAYLNRHGVIAVGKIADEEVFSANSVFGKQDEKEFHRRVKWDVKVTPSQAVSPSQVSQWGYNLPVRSTLCKMNAGAAANRIVDRLAEAAEEP